MKNVLDGVSDNWSIWERKLNHVFFLSMIEWVKKTNEWNDPHSESFPVIKSLVQHYIQFRLVRPINIQIYVIIVKFIICGFFNDIKLSFVTISLHKREKNIRKRHRNKTYLLENKQNPLYMWLHDFITVFMYVDIRE